jgi:2-oxoglutarate ferredoxin oxidoreductase subunit beta
VASAGYPIRVIEMLKELRTPAYLARVAVHEPKAILQAKKVIRTAFQHQAEGTCFSLVEVLSTCPTGWGLPPTEAGGWLAEQMVPYYPLGEFKTPERGVVKETER